MGRRFAPSRPTQEATRLLRADQAAAYLGISPRTLWSLTNCGEIASVRFGAGRRKSVRYDLCDLEAWIEAKKGRAVTSASLARVRQTR